MHEQIETLIDKYSGKNAFVGHQIRTVEQAINDAQLSTIAGDWEMSLACLGIAGKIVARTIETIAPYHEEMQKELSTLFSAIDDAACEIMDRKRMA